MTTNQKSILFLALPLLLLSCSSTKSIVGTYRSNFAVIGFFGTKINLMKDSTFGYRMRGDMMGDTANGKYRIQNHFLILTYDPPIVDTTLYSKYGKDAVVLSQALTNSSGRPKQFYIGHNKLFVTDSLGNVYKKEQGLSRHKKYVFWGQHYMTKRKYYLKRID
jgi:hypothetical protein